MPVLADRLGPVPIEVKVTDGDPSFSSGPMFSYVTTVMGGELIVANPSPALSSSMSEGSVFLLQSTGPKGETRSARGMVVKVETLTQGNDHKVRYVFRIISVKS